MYVTCSTYVTVYVPRLNILIETSFEIIFENGYSIFERPVQNKVVQTGNFRLFL